MKKDELFDLLGINDIMRLPDKLMEVVFMNREERDKIYLRLLEMNGHDVSYDWFQDMYEQELSQRKQKGQDFTNQTVARLCSELTDMPGTRIHEPTAGGGSLIIADWWNRCRRKLPFDFYPSECMYNCWEISDRSIPILLLNLSIRGIMAEVYHGDTLEQTVKQKYIVINRTDDALGFSDVVRVSIKGRIVKV